MAVIKTNNEGKVVVNFIRDDSIIFDCIYFNSQGEAVSRLLYNEFIQIEEHWKKEVLLPPQKPYEKILRPIYSNGEYWEDY